MWQEQQEEGERKNQELPEAEETTRGDLDESKVVLVVTGAFRSITMKPGEWLEQIPEATFDALVYPRHGSHLCPQSSIQFRLKVPLIMHSGWYVMHSVQKYDSDLQNILALHI